MWPAALSGRLPVVATVGRYPTVKLIGSDSIPCRPKAFPTTPCGVVERPALPPVSRSYSGARGRLVTHYSPVRHSHSQASLTDPVRLACVKHAASVQSEPESNSPVEKYLIQRNISFSNRTQSSNFPTRYSLVKEPPPLISGEDALCIICFFLSTTFFKVFSERRFSTPFFPAP